MFVIFDSSEIFLFGVDNILDFLVVGEFDLGNYDDMFVFGVKVVI